jgi:hypothetical protein
MTILARCSSVLFFIALMGCASGTNAQSGEQPPRTVSEYADLPQELRQLTLDLVNSLSPEQVQAANLHHRLHPEYGGTHCERGEGLSWVQLSEPQQQMLRRTWEIVLEYREAHRSPGSPDPGAIEKAELFGVGYAVLDRPSGSTTMLMVQAQRYPMSTTFSVDLPGVAALPPAVQQDGIDLAATGAIRVPTPEELQEEAPES